MGTFEYLQMSSSLRRNRPSHYLLSHKSQPNSFRSFSQFLQVRRMALQIYCTRFNASSLSNDISNSTMLARGRKSLSYITSALKRLAEDQKFLSLGYHNIPSRSRISTHKVKLQHKSRPEESNEGCCTKYLLNNSWLCTDGSPSLKILSKCQFPLP